jgi:hypothetical protein
MSEKKDKKNNKIINIVLGVLGGLFFVWLYFWTQKRNSQGNLSRILLNKQRNTAILNSLSN